MGHSEVVLGQNPLLTQLDGPDLLLGVIPVEIDVLLQALLYQSADSFLAVHFLWPVDRVFVVLADFEVLLVEAEVIVA